MNAKSPGAASPVKPRFALPNWADRRRDHRTRTPADLASAAGDQVPVPLALGLAFQHLAIQAVYLLLPLALARALNLDAADTVRLLSLTLVTMAATTFLHAATRGSVGSGYPLTAIPAPVALPTYLAAGAAGIAPAAAGPAIILAGLAALLLVLALPGFLRRLPVEVAGVVSFSLGTSLLPVAAGLGLHSPAQPLASGFVVGVLGLIILANVLNWRFAAFGLLIGSAVGVVLALPIWPPEPELLEQIDAQPRFMLPMPALLDGMSSVEIDLVPAFLVVSIGMLPGVLANVLTLQRLGNADWLKPDPGPLQRSFVATMLGMVAAGGLGGMASTTSAGGVGLTVATRQMARRIVWVNAALLLALACSPWLLGHLLLLPGPVASAMLLFIACFMLGAGVQQIAGRVLDRRRTCVVGLGLSATFLALLAPGPLGDLLPDALQGPVTLGFLVSLATHLLTLPLVTKRRADTLALDAGMTRAVERFVTGGAGAFGLRRATAEAVGHAAIEVAEILAARGVEKIEADMRVADNRVRLVIRHEGPALPRPSRDPRAQDLAGEDASREAFAMWLAAREADACIPRALGPAGAQVELEFSE